MNIKSFWRSKTFWAGILIPSAIAAIPGAAQWVQQNPQLFSYGIGVFIIVLRIVTKGAISFTPADFGISVDSSATSQIPKV